MEEAHQTRGLLRVEGAPPFGHKLNMVRKNLGPKVRDFLDSKGVPWTTIDIVCFIKVGVGEAVGPVVL